MEIWRGIEGYEGLYQVSSEGRIKNIKRDKILSNLNVNGYKAINLHKNGVMKQYKIHRLVAETFIPNPNSLPQVNHKDENKSNNFVFINEDGSVDSEKSNLEWCDASYNSNYGTRNHRISETKKNILYQYSGNILVAVYPSLSELQTKGFNIGHISECCKGFRKTHKGYRWSYKPL